MPYTTPDNIPHESYEIIPKLHDYQQYAHDFLITHPYAALFLEPGLGKTVITLSVLYDLNPNCNVLIIAPKNIARSTWLDELEKWGLPLRAKSFIVDENDKQLSRKKRLKMYADLNNEKPALYFINNELLPDLIDNTPQWYFPIVIIDESQSFKAYNTIRFKKLKEVRPFIHRLIELTGTPQPNGLMDLWSQIYLLDQGKRLGYNITTYRRSFFNVDLIINNHAVKWSPMPGAEDEIYRRISDIVISMKNKFSLPVTYNDIFVHMEPEEQKTYDLFKKTKVMTFIENTHNGDRIKSIIAKNAAVLSGKLRQMASGAIYTDDNHNYEIIHKRKLEHTAYILRNTSSPVLIAYHFHSDRQMLEKYLTKEKFFVKVFDGTKQMITDWNNGKIPVMLLQPASAGRGLNLQAGGHTLIWYTIPWSLEEYEQTNMRILRQGQKNHVIIHHLLTKNTIDKQVLHALKIKSITQQNLIDAVLAQI